MSRDISISFIVCHGSLDLCDRIFEIILLMIFAWNYLIFMAILFSVQYLYSTDFIFTIVNGRLSDAWQFDFGIFATVFQGVVFYSIDSQGNKLGLTVQPGGRTSEGTMRLISNQIRQDIPVVKLCGCHKCDGTTIAISIRSNKSLITIICNHRFSNALHIFQSNEKDIYMLPTPLDFLNTTNMTLIKLGNIGQYVGEGGVVVPPIREQLTACLYSFIFNNVSLAFRGKQGKVLSSCPCNMDPCNGGHCREVRFNNFTCECSSAERRGRYCNRTLETYVPGPHNSFVKIGNSVQTYLEIRWRQKKNNAYCLLEIVSIGETFTIWFNTKHLLINSVIISNIDPLGINIIKVNITNNVLVIKTKMNTTAIYFKLNNMKEIHLGSSGNSNTCGTLEGEYDFHYDSTVLRPITGAHHKIDSDVVNGNHTLNTTGGMTGTTILLMFIAMLLVAILSILLYRYTIISSACSCPATDGIIGTENRDVLAGGTYDYSVLHYTDPSDVSSCFHDTSDYVHMSKRSSVLSSVATQCPTNIVTDIYDYLPMMGRTLSIMSRNSQQILPPLPPKVTP